LIKAGTVISMKGMAIPPEIRYLGTGKR